MFTDLLAHAQFAPDRMQKVDIARSGRMFVGLNCLNAGQSQRVHTHAESDKFYLVLQGRATISIGDERQTVGPGTLAWAPAGVPHGIERAEEESVIVVGMAPGEAAGR